MTEQAKSLTVEQARAAVLASGELVGFDGPHYLASEDAEWLGYHVAKTPPILARVIITRRGHEPRTVPISWEEYEAQEQTDPNWNATRAEKPMTIFGSEVERHAYRVVFADVLAPLLAEISERKSQATSGEPGAGESWESAEPARDWIAELHAAASSLVKLDLVYSATKGKGRLPEHEVLWRKLRRVLLDAPLVESATPAAPETAVMPGIVPRPPAPNVPHLTDPVRKGRKS